jgi:glycosyltransferase involved in cell wall biosynthesis
MLRDIYLKILFIAPLPPPITGQSLACNAFIENIKTRGHEVTLVNLSKATLDSGKASWKRVKEVFMHFKLIAENCKNKDLIYFNPSQSFLGNVKDLIIFLILFNQLDKTYIHMHGGAGMHSYFKHKLNPLVSINRFFIKRIAGAIVLGERLTEIYDGMLSPKKIYTVKNFSMPEYFISVYNLRQKIKQPLNILFLSNLLPEKGYQDLLTAYKLLPKFIQENISLHFAGGFKDIYSCELFVEDIKTLSNVHYYGTVTGAAKVDLLSRAQIFCLPTYYPYEGQPISILEAYASGCVVLTTNHSGIFDVFTPGVNGLEVEPQSPTSISNAIEIIYNDRKLLRKYSIVNAFHARQYYTIDKHLDKMNSILLGNNEVI